MAPNSARSNPARSSAKNDRNAWADGTRPDPAMKAPPRWSFPQALQGKTPSFANGAAQDQSGGDRKSKNKHTTRETFIDELLRAEEDMGTGEQLGPGTHSPLCVDRTFEPILADVHGKRVAARRNVGGGGAFNKTPMTRHLATLKEVAQVTPSRLPSSFHSPGPGAYTAFSSFGQASGPSREHYYPKSRSELANAGRHAVPETPRALPSNTPRGVPSTPRK